MKYAVATLASTVVAVAAVLGAACVLAAIYAESVEGVPSDYWK